MITAWMTYTLITSLLLLVAGYAAERLARSVGAPTRGVWAGAVVLAMLLSGWALISRAAPVAAASDVSASATSIHYSGTVQRGVGQPARTAPPPYTSQPATSPTRMLDAAVLRLDQPRLVAYDKPLTAIGLGLAAAGLLVVVASFARLRRIARTLEPAVLDGAPVLLSHDLGPAVLGVLRPHVVVPRWVAELPDEERRTILLHEQEHARARDPVLVLLGVVVIALQPWNVPLWIAVARLRFALETDCDARVLRTGYGARRYGALLLRVYEHGLPSMMPVTAFVESTSRLERRIRRMTDRQPPLRSLSTAAALVAALLFAGVAVSVRVSAQRSVTPAAAPRNVDEVAARTAAPIPAPGMPRQDSVVQTLLVHASNPEWPQRVRVISPRSGGMTRVVVSDTLGRVIGAADTVIANGPVRLLLPAGAFQLRVESMAGDMTTIIAPVPAPLTRYPKGFLGAVYSRTLVASRATVGGEARITAPGAAMMKGQVVR